MYCLSSSGFDEMPLKGLRYLSQSTDSLHKTSKVNESTESLTDEGEPHLARVQLARPSTQQLGHRCALRQKKLSQPWSSFHFLAGEIKEMGRVTWIFDVLN